MFDDAGGVWYSSIMLNIVQIARNECNGDVLDVIEHLKGEYGSFANAVVQCVRDSEIYEKARQELAEAAKTEKPSKKQEHEHG